MIYLLINLFVSSIFLIASGNYLLQFLRIKKKIHTTESGLFGFIFLGFISLFLNFFLPLSKNLNTSIFLLFIFFLFSKIKIN